MQTLGLHGPRVCIEMRHCQQSCSSPAVSSPAPRQILQWVQHIHALVQIEQRALAICLKNAQLIYSERTWLDTGAYVALQHSTLRNTPHHLRWARRMCNMLSEAGPLPTHHLICHALLDKAMSTHPARPATKILTKTFEAFGQVTWVCPEMPNISPSGSRANRPAMAAAATQSIQWLLVSDLQPALLSCQVGGASTQAALHICQVVPPAGSSPRPRWSHSPQASDFFLLFR